MNLLCQGPDLQLVDTDTYGPLLHWALGSVWVHRRLPGPLGNSGPGHYPKGPRSWARLGCQNGLLNVAGERPGEGEGNGPKG